MSFVCKKKGIVYCLFDEKNGICRIGQSTCNDLSRIKQQASYYPFKLTYVTIEVENTNHCEKYYHRLFANKKLNGDWFEIITEDFLSKESEYRTAWDKDWSISEELHRIGQNNGRGEPLTTTYECAYCYRKIVKEEVAQAHAEVCKRRRNKEVYYSVVNYYG